MFVSHDETHNDMASMSNFNDILRDLNSWIQLQKSLLYNMYCCCNALYSSEFYILVYRLPEDGRVPSKYVGVNKRLYFKISWPCIVTNSLWKKTNRRTGFQFYRCYDSTCFEQSLCPSSEVLSRTSALVHFMQFLWPFATRSRMELCYIL